MEESKEYQTIRYEMPAEGVARVILARPERANAQNNTLLYELNSAFERAARDNTVRVIILAAEGAIFSAGHDLSEGEFDPSLRDVTPVGVWGGFDLPGAEGYWAFEEEAYLGLCMRWRDIPKPTIAAIQGKAIAAGLMLAWCCDLIVATEETVVQDPVVAFGMNGVEYFAHAWELGPRKAKEMLFTGRGITAACAKSLGMINRVVASSQLEAETLDLAKEIAVQPSMGLKLAKTAVNQSVDAQGFTQALKAAMGLQQLGHSHNRERFQNVGNPDGYQIVRDLAKKPPLE